MYNVILHRFVNESLKGYIKEMLTNIKQKISQIITQSFSNYINIGCKNPFSTDQKDSNEIDNLGKVF